MDWTKLTDQVGKIKVKNVVDMPLFYALWVLAFAVISAVCCLHEWITITLFCFAAVLLFLAAFGYFFFTFKNPDYLRSEEYHLRKQSLEILGDKENLLPVNPQNIVDVSNPYNSTIEDGTTETQDDV
jgi:glucose uptake protein GlcU